MNRILITGASGFVGRKLANLLLRDGCKLNLAGRTAKSWPAEGDVCSIGVGPVNANTDWTEALRDCDRIVHLAAQVPMRGVADATMDEVNDQGTARLVEQAVASGVTQFVSVSSLSVNDHTTGRPVNEDTPEKPTTAYGRSKLAAEQHVKRFAGEGRTATILRPPIVYGGAAGGNWRPLQRLAASGMPLPVASINNRRTLIAADNLAEAIRHVLLLPEDRRRSGVYMIADSESVSLREILLFLRTGMGLKPRLFPFPKVLLDAPLRVIGAGKLASSLLDDLEVDAHRFRETFDWSPGMSAREAMVRSGAEFVRNR